VALCGGFANEAWWCTPAPTQGEMSAADKFDNAFFQRLVGEGTFEAECAPASCEEEKGSEVAKRNGATELHLSNPLWAEVMGDAQAAVLVGNAQCPTRNCPFVLRLSIQGTLQPDPISRGRAGCIWHISQQFLVGQRTCAGNALRVHCRNTLLWVCA
jgi:hypothetical protein